MDGYSNKVMITREGKVSGGVSVKLEEAGWDTGVKPSSLQRLSQRHGGSAWHTHTAVSSLWAVNHEDVRGAGSFNVSSKWAPRRNFHTTTHLRSSWRSRDTPTLPAANTRRRALVTPQDREMKRLGGINHAGLPPLASITLSEKTINPRPKCNLCYFSVHRRLCFKPFFWDLGHI